MVAFCGPVFSFHLVDSRSARGGRRGGEMRFFPCINCKRACRPLSYGARRKRHRNRRRINGEVFFSTPARGPSDSLPDSSPSELS